VEVEPVTRESPRPVRRTILTQRWCDLSFLHWPVHPARVAPLLPPSTRPDVHDGTSWVGLIAFRMYRIGLGRMPGLPYLGTFPETNVRLYSIDGQGRRGVVFRSLDASRLMPVLVARSLFSLPYMWSSMTVGRSGDVVTYASRRRWPGHARTRLTVRVGSAITTPTSLEDFLTARWGLHVFRYRRTLYLPNVHPPWPLYQAELIDLDEELVAAAGLPGISRPPTSVLFSPGVPVRFGPPMEA
jgi:uncharacterized protein